MSRDHRAAGFASSDSGGRHEVLAPAGGARAADHAPSFLTLTCFSLRQLPCPRSLLTPTPSTRVPIRTRSDIAALHLLRSVVVAVCAIALAALQCADAFSAAPLGLHLRKGGLPSAPRQICRAAVRMAEKGPMHDAIDKVVKENKIILFMKGNKDFPQCGFSNTVTQVCTAGVQCVCTCR